MKLWDFFAKMPAVNVKLTFAMLLALGTAVKVLVFNWEPTLLWLGFVGAWDGLALGQYATKRLTDYDYVEAKNAPPIVVESVDPDKPLGMGGA